MAFFFLSTSTPRKGTEPALIPDEPGHVQDLHQFLGLHVCE